MDENQKKKLLYVGGALLVIIWFYNKGRNDELIKICNKATFVVLKTRFEK